MFTGQAVLGKYKTVLFKLRSSEIQHAYRATDFLMHLNDSFVSVVSAKKRICQEALNIQQSIHLCRSSAVREQITVVVSVL